MSISGDNAPGYLQGKHESVVDSGCLRASQVLGNKASGDSVLQVLGNKARKKCQIVPFLPMCSSYLLQGLIFLCLHALYILSADGLGDSIVLWKFLCGNCRQTRCRAHALQKSSPQKTRTLRSPEVFEMSHGCGATPPTLAPQRDPVAPVLPPPMSLSALQLPEVSQVEVQAKMDRASSLYRGVAATPSCVSRYIVQLRQPPSGT